MTVADAKTYISRIIGGSNTQGVLDMAGEAIQRAYADWQSARFWTFLLKDTSATTTLTVGTVTASIAGTPPTSSFEPAVVGDLDFVNIGQTVSYVDNSTTYSKLIKSFDRNTSGSIIKVYLDSAITGTPSSFTFSADIPLNAGQGEYNVPNDMNGTYTARLIGANDDKTWLKFIEQRHWDKISYDQTINGKPEGYTIYNPVSQATQGYGRKRMQIFRIPNASATLRLRYFRNFDTSASVIDVPDDYLYKFLDYARALLLEAKRAQDDPNGYRASILGSYAEAQQNDEQPNDDDDGDQRLKSPYESGNYRGPIVNNGQFDPYPL